MNYNVLRKGDLICVVCDSAEPLLHSEQDGLDLIAACWEHDTKLLMLHAEALSPDFFELRTGLAGAVLQKLVNYGIRTAAVIPSDLQLPDRTRELLAESNKGMDFRAFASAEEAESWLFAPEGAGGSLA